MKSWVQKVIDDAVIRTDVHSYVNYILSINCPERDRLILLATNYRKMCESHEDTMAKVHRLVN